MKAPTHLLIPKVFAIAGAVLALAPMVCANPSQDLLVGNGTTGPYPLSWKNIDSNTEIVQVNQQTQMRGIDYTLDPLLGTVTFVRPLTVQSAASVHYDYDPARAVRGSLVSKVPVSFDLADRNGSRVSFDALYQASTAASASAAPGSLTLGLGTSLQSGSTQWATHLLFAPSLGNDTGAQSRGSLSQMGVSLSGTTQASHALKISFGYGQAGAMMTTASDNGLLAGRQTMTLGTAFAPSQQVQASVNWTQSDPTTAAGGASSTQTSAALSLAPAANLSLQTHWTDVSGGSAPDAQTADISLHAAPTRISKVDATFTTKSSADPAADTQALNLAAALAPSKQIALSAAVGQTRDLSGPVNQQQVGVVLTPGSKVQVQTSLALHQTQAALLSTAIVAGQVQPVSFLQFAATYKDRTASAGDSAAADSLDTSLLSLTLLPLHGVRLTGSYAQNPDSGGVTPQALAQRGLGLETTLGALSVSGGYDWQRPTDTQLVGTTFHVGVGLHLSSATQINGSYAQTLSATGGGPTGTSIYGFGLTHTLGDRFNLSMAGTMHAPISPAAVPVSPDYTANASLGMKF